MSVLLGFIKNSSIVYFEILNSSFIFSISIFNFSSKPSCKDCRASISPWTVFISLLSFKALLTPLELVATFETIAVLLDFPKKAPKIDVPIDMILFVVALRESCSSFFNFSKSFDIFCSKIVFSFSNFCFRFSIFSSICSFNLSCILILKSSKLSYCFDDIFKVSFLYRVNLKFLYT